MIKVGFSTLVKELGFGRITKYIPYAADTGKTWRQGLVIFENGTQGVYDIARENGQLRQTISAGYKRAEAVTKESEIISQNLFNGTTKQVIPQTRMSGYIKDLNKVSYALDYTKTPHTPIAAIQNGKVKYTVPITREIHESKLVNNMLLPEDKLIAPNGKWMPIYQRPMQCADRLDIHKAWYSNTFQG